MLLIMVDHVAHVWNKICIFEKLLHICSMFLCKQVNVPISFASYSKLPSNIIAMIPLMTTVINLDTKWYPNKINLNAFMWFILAPPGWMKIAQFLWLLAVSLVPSLFNLFIVPLSVLALKQGLTVHKLQIATFWDIYESH